MTRLFLAAGVAALAIAAPASAKPGGNGGGQGGDKKAAQVSRGGGGHAEARGGGGHAEARGDGGAAVRMQSRGGGHGGGDFAVRGGGRGSSAFAFERRGGGGIASQRMQRQAFAFQDRGHGHGGGSMKLERRNTNVGRTKAVEQRGHGADMKAQRFEQRQARTVERQQIRGNRLEQNRGRALQAEAKANRLEQVGKREAFRDELRANRIERMDNGIFVRDARLGTRVVRAEDFGPRVRGFGIGGCPPGLMDKGCMPPGQAAKLLGTRFSDAERIVTLGSVPYSVRYLYPDTNDFYYRYGDGYMYRVDRGSSLIDALLPLAFGGYMPGSYFPSSYMNNYYVPSSYGFNSFYPDSPYNCNRYVNGVIYQVDCMTGFVENVIPMYAGGYGVGQMLPTGYGYYNVPYQYRDMYYDTSDYGYWYAPGAIYQYDPSSSMITSVAALLSPGFNIGQPLPMGYDVYNVPYDYRATYYDTPSAMYRYNNGNIYQVDPATMLVTAIVASILT
jgi:hypothetical protein